jgi:hypothetical protein
VRIQKYNVINGSVIQHGLQLCSWNNNIRIWEVPNERILFPLAANPPTYLGARPGCLNKKSSLPHTQKGTIEIMEYHCTGFYCARRCVCLSMCIYIYRSRRVCFSTHTWSHMYTCCFGSVENLSPEGPFPGIRLSLLILERVVIHPRGGVLFL